jgi:hypothetical protein
VSSKAEFVKRGEFSVRVDVSRYPQYTMVTARAFAFGVDVGVASRDDTERAERADDAWIESATRECVDEAVERGRAKAAQFRPAHKVTFSIIEGRAQWTCSCHAYMEESVSIDNFQIAQATALDHLEDAGFVQYHKAVDYHHQHGAGANPYRQVTL